jgi:beta-glucosidase/6-phospho-beta-glucosidase/beta-galactosidase
MREDIFRSYVMGGFECSTHRRFDGRRLDLINATRHDEFAEADYRRLSEIGIFTARDGLRWHLIEKSSFRYDFSSVASQMEAAERTGVQIVWDLFHYGFPDDINIFGESFPQRFAHFAEAFAQFHRRATGRAPIVCPVNEISFFSWIAGDIGRFHPFAVGRGDELKKQMVRASIAAIEAVWSVCPRARVVHTEPAVYVTARPEQPEFFWEAESYRLAQYEAFDMLSGRLAPELGGKPEYLDILGLNYYLHNQWFFPDREMISPDSECYRPLREILLEIHERYCRPMFIAETGTEDDLRPEWFRYVADESRAAINFGVDLHGICLYPILNHPGWEDERHCHNGLWDYADNRGNRQIYEPLAREVLQEVSRKSYSYLKAVA